MPYLTKEEFTERTGNEAPVDFDKLLRRASLELDILTRSFYQKNDLDTDIEFRRDRFKEAVALQIEYFVSLGYTSLEALNNRPDSVSIGNTTVRYNATISSAQESLRKSIVSDDVVNCLRGTGLLYRGVGRYV